MRTRLSCSGYEICFSSIQYGKLCVGLLCDLFLDFMVVILLYVYEWERKWARTPPQLDDRMFHKQDCYLSASDTVAKTISLAVLLHLHHVCRAEMPHKHEQHRLDQLGRAPAIPSEPHLARKWVLQYGVYQHSSYLCPENVIKLDCVSCPICSGHIPICWLGDCLSSWSELVLFSWCAHKDPLEYVLEHGIWLLRDAVSVCYGLVVGNAIHESKHRVLSWKLDWITCLLTKAVISFIDL